MNYTTIEQSKKLVELGLNPDTADMKWFYWKGEIDAPKVPTLGFDKIALESYKNTQAIYLPCWSLGSLLDLMPKSLEDKINYYEITIYYSKTECEWYLGYLTIDMRRTLRVFHNASLIEAAYNMVCWLLKNSYIKKGE